MSPRTLTVRLVSLLLGVLVTACAPSPRVSWEVVLGETSSDAAWIVVERRAGDCDGPAQDIRVVTRAAAGSLRDASLSLASGPQAFAAVVLDASCRVIGEGCTDLVLGAASPAIVVRVGRVTASDCGADCAVPECARSGPDSGGLDGGGLDAPQRDATAEDVRVVDAGDGGPPDANVLACRANATSFEECETCPGIWCDSSCCPPAFECCADGTCRRICDMMMMPP